MALQLCQSREVWKLPGTIVVIVCNLIASIGCFHFIISILSRNSARKNTFNLYIVFLIFPDWLSTLVAIVSNAIVASKCEIPEWYKDVSHFVFSFYYFSNFYLNCCVAYEIYTMVEESHRLRRTQPPTMRKVFLQVGCVYSLSVLVALWAILDVSWSWYDVKNLDFGSPDGGSFSKIGSMTFAGTTVLVPISFVVGLRIRMWSKRLMQNEGRTRTLYLFFERITIIFVAMYIPGIGLIFAMDKLDIDGNAHYWVELTFDSIIALQALMTLYIVSLKEDISNVVACACFSAGDTTDEVEADLERCDKDAFSVAYPAVSRSGTRTSIAPFSMTEKSETIKALPSSSQSNATEACTEAAPEAEETGSRAGFVRTEEL